MVGAGSGHGSGTPLSWPGPPPPTFSHQYCTRCPTRPALVPRANTGGRHAKHPCQVHPPISTNGPQERALSPTSTAGTGTAASLEQVRGTPESLWLLPTKCIHSHIHTQEHTHTRHVTEGEGKGEGKGLTAHMIRGGGEGIPKCL